MGAVGMHDGDVWSSNLGSWETHMGTLSDAVMFAFDGDAGNVTLSHAHEQSSPKQSKSEKTTW
jgi:hypothetical protein